MEPQAQNPALAIQAAMARRNMGQPTGALNQVSNQAQTANPVPQPMPQSEMNKSSSPQGQAPIQNQKYEPKNQEDLIVMALTEQLKNSHKLKVDQMKLGAQQQAQPPMPMPVGAGGGMDPYFGGGALQSNDVTENLNKDPFTPPKTLQRDYFSLGQPSMATSQKQSGYPF